MTKEMLRICCNAEAKDCAEIYCTARTPHTCIGTGSGCGIGSKGGYCVPYLPIVEADRILNKKVG